MTTANRNKLFVTILIALMIFGWWINKRKREIIRDKGILSIAKITEVKWTRKPVLPRIAYTFTAKGKLVTTYQNIEQGLDFNNLKKLKGGRVYVMYDSSDIMSNTLLISKQDYEFFRVSFSDSIQWVK